MIKLTTSSLMILLPDGRSKVFEPEDIQAKLINSCIAAGMKESWIAEDIALSIEHSLQELSSSKVFTMAEIDSFVIKLLTEIGLQEIANFYGTTQEKGLKTVSTNLEKITEIVGRYLGIKGEELQLTSNKVYEACKTLALKDAFPSLILEFAKHYHHEDFKIATEAISFNINDKPYDTWAIKSSQILKMLSPSTSKFESDNIITISGVSKLFPSIRLNVNLANLAKSYNLLPPITELEIYPFIFQLSKALDEIIIKTEQEYSKSFPNSEKLPVYMKFTDVILFSTRWLGAEWPESTQCVKEIIASLLDIMKSEVNLRSLSI